MTVPDIAARVEDDALARRADMAQRLEAMRETDPDGYADILRSLLDRYEADPTQRDRAANLRARLEREGLL